MASLFKPQIVRRLGPDGKRCAPGVKRAKRRVSEAAKWYAKGVPGWPKGKKAPLATDKRVAQKILADLVERAGRFTITVQNMRADRCSVHQRIDLGPFDGVARPPTSGRGRSGCSSHRVG